MAKTQPPPGEEYRGLAGGLKDSRFLSAECLPESQDDEKPIDVLVEIEKVLVRRDFDMFRGPQEKERVAVAGFLKFVGREKELKLSETNRKTLVRMFGPDTSNWFGKKVILFVDHKEAFGNPRFPWIRIRNKDVNAQSGGRNMRVVAGGGGPEPVRQEAPAPAERPDVPWEPGSDG